jgi:CSLREA domain-containing protein
MMLASYFRISAVVLAMAGAVLLAVVMWHASPASAIGTTAVPGTTIVVNTDEDESNTDGDCSLREAIGAANTNVGVDRCAAGSATQRDAIHFSLGQEATITLGSTLPNITDASGLNINGRRAKITVSGDDSVRVFEVGSGAKLTLANLAVADGFSNSGGGLFNNGGTVTVLRSTFSGNSTSNNGGGMSNASGTLTVDRSTFSGNNANFGGGLSNGGTLTVTNSTFSGNSTSTEGGGIYNNAFGSLTVSYSTFSGNSAGTVGGGIYNGSSTANVTLSNTIVANSTSGGNCGGPSPAVTDGGYNIDDATTCGFSSANNSMPSTNPLLAPSLANNGGPTQTIALMNGSPALNAIPKATNGCGTEVTTDQRGVKRPQGNKCDVGAFEKKMRR